MAEPTKEFKFADYLKPFPAPVRARLRSLYQTIKKAAPCAEVVISYGIPTFRTTENLVHFAAYEHHIGLYPGAQAIAEFRPALAKFKGAKGSVRFPHEHALPLALVKRIVRFRVKQAKVKALAKLKIKKSAAKNRRQKST